MASVAKFSKIDFESIAEKLNKGCIRRISQFGPGSENVDFRHDSYFYLMRDGVRVVQHTAHFLIEGNTKAQVEEILRSLEIDAGTFVQWIEVPIQDKRSGPQQR